MKGNISGSCDRASLMLQANTRRGSIQSVSWRWA